MKNKQWESMNDLEMVTSKIVSAREIIDTAIDRIQEHQYDKAETLMSAAHEFLEYYLNEFDEKFKVAWKETVTKSHEEINQKWNDFWDTKQTIQDRKYSAQYTDEELNAMCDAAEKEQQLSHQEAVKEGWEMTDDGIWMPPEKSNQKWTIPIEVDGPSGEYYVTLPDDLLSSTNIQEGDTLEWYPSEDGSYILKKYEK
jgi:hypothetical protein